MQKIAAFLGPGGSGKSTHAAYARDIFKLEKPKNYTTRDKRDEKDTDYEHIDLTTFQGKLTQGELFNAINFDGNLYGFDNNSIITAKKLILCITPQALGYIQEYTKKTKTDLITLFFDAPEDILRERILKRGVSLEETNRRIVTDKLENKNRPYTYDHLIQTDMSKEDVRIEIMPILEHFFGKN